MERSRRTIPSHCVPPGSRQEGFTLLGVAIALTVTVIVGGAITSLAARTMGATRTSNERFIATALAREGVELVRWIRDTNYLATERGANTITWRRGICDGTWIIDPELSELTAPSGSSLNGELFLVSGSQPGYRHTPSGTPTRFRRRMMVETTDGDDPGTGVESNCTAGVPTNDPSVNMPDPVTVRSLVEWGPTGGPFQSVQLVEQLYHWVRRRE